VPLERLQIKSVPGLHHNAPTQGQSQNRVASTTRRPLPDARRSSQEEAYQPADSSFPSSSQTQASAADGADSDVDAEEQPERARQPSSSPEVESGPLNGYPRLSHSGVASAGMPRRIELMNEESDEGLTSSALRGGAVKGLLSLSRG
jgi:hypothetical protein